MCYVCMAQRFTEAAALQERFRNGTGASQTLLGCCCCCRVLLSLRLLLLLPGAAVFAAAAEQCALARILLLACIDPLTALTARCRAAVALSHCSAAGVVSRRHAAVHSSQPAERPASQPATQPTPASLPQMCFNKTRPFSVTCTCLLPCRPTCTRQWAPTADGSWWSTLPCTGCT